MKHAVITALFAAALSSLNINIAEAATKSPQVDVVQSQTEHQSVNINTASVQELALLNGVGESKAKAIIEYRTSNGPFDSIDDLAKVKGIGTKLVEKNKALITL